MVAAPYMLLCLRICLAPLTANLQAILMISCGANGWDWLSSRTVASFAPGCNMTKPLTATPEALLLCENMVLYPSVPICTYGFKAKAPPNLPFWGHPVIRIFWTTQMSPTFGTQPDGSASASFSAFCSASQPGSRSCVLSRGCAKMDSQRYLKFHRFSGKNPGSGRLHFSTKHP